MRPRAHGTFFQFWELSRRWAGHLLPDEDRAGAEDVVMLSWSLFQSRFGGDRTIIGKHIRMDAKPYTVVGVLPAQFSYPDPVSEIVDSVFLGVYGTGVAPA